MEKALKNLNQSSSKKAKISPMKHADSDENEEYKTANDQSHKKTDKLTPYESVGPLPKPFTPLTLHQYASEENVDTDTSKIGLLNSDVNDLELSKIIHLEKINENSDNESVTQFPQNEDGRKTDKTEKIASHGHGHEHGHGDGHGDHVHNSRANTYDESV